MLERVEATTNACLSFGEHVLLTPTFVRSWEALSRAHKCRIEPKIRLLCANQAHPSLHVHRHHRLGENIWICQLSHGSRLLYTRVEARLSLLEVGPHRILDRAHQRRFVHRQ